MSGGILRQVLRWDHCLSAVVFCAALGTAICHVVVPIGGSLRLLVAVEVGAAVLGLTLLASPRVRRTAVRWTHQALLEGDEIPPAVPLARSTRTFTWFLAVVSAILVSQDRYVGAWAAVALALAIGVVSTRRAALDVVLARPTARQVGLLGLLAGALIVASLAVHRPDEDDAFYIGWAAGAAEHPDEPVATEHYFGQPLPLHLSPYRVHAWEPLAAAATWLAGTEAWPWFHWFLSSASVLAMTLCLAAVWRALLPDQWLVALVFQGALWALVDGPHRWHGNLAIFRAWQGKALLVTAILPLLWIATANACRRLNGPSVAFLGALAWLSVGVSVNAVWMTPAVVAVAAVSSVSVDDLHLRRRGLIGLAALAALLIVIAIVVRATLSFQVAAPQPLDLSQYGSIVAKVLGTERLAALSFAALAGAWAVAPSALAQRLFAGPLLGLWLTLGNPFFGPLLPQVVGPSTWRSFWVLPIPLALTLVASAAYRAMRRVLAGGASGWLATTASALLVVALIAQLTPGVAFSSGNGAELRWPPTAKTRAPSDRIAALVAEHVGPGRLVAAPEWISVGLAIRRGGPHLVALRSYLESHKPTIEQADVSDRQRLVHLCRRGPLPRNAEVFAGLLATVKPDAVVFRFRSKGLRWQDRFFREAGYRRTAVFADHAVYTGKALDLEVRRGVGVPGLGPAKPGKSLSRLQ